MTGRTVKPADRGQTHPVPDLLRKGVRDEHDGVHARRAVPAPASARADARALAGAATARADARAVPGAAAAGTGPAPPAAGAGTGPALTHARPGHPGAAAGA